MSFRQQLARHAVSAQQAYDVETERMLQAWLAETRQKFTQDCEEAARQRDFTCCVNFRKPDHLQYRGLRDDFLKQQLRGILMELGFPDGRVTECEVYDDSDSDTWEESAVERRRRRAQKPRFRIEVEWSPEDATCTESPPQAIGGTCATCPICHEHRPAVALVPCGHVICRDCHRCQRLRQCPMCRGAITSATNGLFMD